MKEQRIGFKQLCKEMELDENQVIAKIISITKILMKTHENFQPCEVPIVICEVIVSVLNIVDKDEWNQSFIDILKDFIENKVKQLKDRVKSNEEEVLIC